MKIQQKLTGDRNQAIGQVLGGIVVYVSGGQAVFHSASTETDSSNSKAIPSEIGLNPYKGLTAFQETDGDRFFGREKQIAALWQKLRNLHETEDTVRVLPIYGPSGSGKSSLARAGLIPELAQCPIPGYDRARIAILVPGTRPLEALAGVLARIATNDPVPVEKAEEFERVLNKITDNGIYEGLRRIANNLPENNLFPLIILIDQFEEVYSLCESLVERDAFIANVLEAARDQSRYVSVVITLRSDFLGATQKHPLLNQLISAQGFFVPAMSTEELRQTIEKPAVLANHPLDKATISLLLEQTEGREGALPLLQFALARIWEGLREGISPAVMLEHIGGVGGALAGEAQRIYDKLTPVEQAIAQRVFLGLVQLGEGTRDTRRRVAIDNLVSYKDDLHQVKQVLDRFSEPGLRLITRSASSAGVEMVEVTHEALFLHWQLLNQWLEQNRNDLRFQRRLEDAAHYWQQHGRPEGTLWRRPDLDLLKRYYRRTGDNMTPLQVDFFKVSEQAENNRKRARKLGIAGLLVGLVLTTILTVFSLHQLQQAQRQRVELLAATAEASLSSQPVNAVINSIAAVGLSQSLLIRLPNVPMPDAALDSLLLSVQVNQEQKLLPHEDEVYSVAFSPDGKMIASGSRDKTIRLWDSSTGKPIGQPLRGHKDVVYSVAFSPDGKMIASGSRDKTIRLWDSSTGKPIGQPLRGHEDVYSVAFSPNGKMIASGSFDKTVRLWDVSTGKLIGQPLYGHEDAVRSVTFSPNGKMIASGSFDKTVRLWDVSTGKLIGQPLYGHEDAIYSVVFSPDGKMTASSSRDKTVRLWDVGTGKPIGQSLQGHETEVDSVAFSPDGKTIASGSFDKTIRLWDASTGKPIGLPLRGHETDVYSVVFSPDGKTIASSSFDKTVRLWSVTTSKLIGQPLYGHEDVVYSVAFSPNAKIVVSGSSDKTVRLWDINTGKPIGQSLRGHEDVVYSVAFSPNGKVIASGSRDKTIRLWNVSTRKPIGEPFEQDDTIYSVAFSPNGKMIVSGSRDRTVRLWDVGTGKPIGQPLRGHEDTVYSPVFSPDGKMIVSGSRDKTIQLWDVSTGKLIGQPLRGHEDIVYSVAFSPDGKMIASGSWDRTVRLWDVGTGKPIGQPLRGHEASISAVAFSPDGKMIASGSRDKTLRLWDVITGQPIGQPLRGHEDTVHSVAFSPNGKMIASGSRDKTLRLWDLSSINLETLLQLACQQLRYHSSLLEPRTEFAREAKQTCERDVWASK